MVPALAPFTQTNDPASPGPFGYGTTPAVESLFRTLQETRENKPTCVAINLATLIRNAVSNKSANVNDVVTLVRKNMTDIAAEYVGIVSGKWPDFRHHLFYYLVDSSKAIPPEYCKISNSPTTKIIQAATNMLKNFVKDGDQDEQNVSAHVRITDQMRVASYRGLRECISKFVRPEVDLHLISHMPTDYHVTFMTGRTGYLYRAHTGAKIKMTPSELGMVVFKNPDIPFYPITHVMFGDSHLIKGSLRHSEKVALLEQAKQGHWGVRTNSYIEVKVKENRIQLPYVL